MIRPKQIKARSVPDSEVRLTFWAEEDVQTRRGTAQQMQKISTHYLQACRVAILSTWCPDEEGARTPPGDTSAGILHVTSLHPHTAL